MVRTGIVKMILKTNYYYSTASFFRLEVIDLEEIEDSNWEFPDRDFFSCSERDANFKMIRISNCLSEEELEVVFADS